MSYQQNIRSDLERLPEYHHCGFFGRLRILFIDRRENWITITIDRLAAFVNVLRVAHRGRSVNLYAFHQRPNSNKTK